MPSDVRGEAPIAPSGRHTVVALATAVVAVAAAAAVIALGLDSAAWYTSRSVPLLLLIVAATAVVFAMLGVMRDREAGRSLRHRIEASDQRDAGIVAISVDAIITIDESQSIVMFNQGAEDTFGWDAAEVTGKPLLMLLPARHHAAHTAHVERFGRGTTTSRHMGERQEIRGLRKDGTEFPAEASISHMQLGGRHLYSVVLRDVTARHRQHQDQHFLAAAGATLSASLDYESTLLSAVNLPVPHLADCCVLDLCTDGKWRRIASVHEDALSTRALRAFAEESTPGSDWPFRTAAAYAATAPLIRDSLEPGWERAGTSNAAAVDQLAELDVRAFMSAPLEARGNTLGVLTFLSTDPARGFESDRQVAALSVANLIALAIDNAGLYHAARSATQARDEILGVVSHDLRNPLSAITMCASVLREQGENAVDRLELVTAIIQATDMMGRLIRDLLDVSTIESGHLRVDPKPHDVNDLTEQALEMFRTAAGERQIALRTRIPEGPFRVLVDETRFVQVLANLLDNAVKFSEAGGTVTVAVQELDGRALIAVRDSGPGIPAGHLPYVFDRHWHARRTARRAGTGLGLAIARGIVEAHGGRIWVESGDGPGCTFWFTVPRTGTNSPDGRQPLAPASERLH
jgi:PAS domain S-box-containing protein